MATQHFLRRGVRRYSNGEATDVATVITPSGTTGAINTANWVNLLLSEGADVPTTAIQTALSAFYDGLVTDGLLSSMLYVICCPPWDVGATSSSSPPHTHAKVCAMGLTPYIYSVTSGLSNIFGIAGGNGQVITPAGIPGNVPNNWNDHTKIDITNAFPSDNSAGMTVYNMSGQGASPTGDMGCENSSLVPSAYFMLFCNYSGSAYFYCWTASADGTVSGTLPVSTFSGYVSGNRTSSNSLALYCANSTTPHQIVGTTSTPLVSGRNRTTFNDPVLWGATHQDDLGSDSYHSDKTFSFMAFHLGLTQAQSALFFKRIQTMRIAFGGGHV